MDMKRFNKITWQEAVVKWSNGEHVFSSTGRTYYMEGDTLHFFLGGEDNGSESTAFFNDITKEEWYVKKPFDVRAEMLARPNEWVGAYQANEMWWKVALRLDRMEAVITSYKSTRLPLETHVSEYVPFFDHCIPIEDVPEEANQ